MKHPLRTIFFGTPDFAVPALAALVENENFEVQAVVTQEDKKVGRKQILTPPPVKQYALEKGIPVLQPPKLRQNEELIQLLQQLKPDFMVVVVYGKLLPKALLDVPRYGCVNIHPSLLPKYRGPSPFSEALLHGDTVTGVSFMKMAEEMDSGPVYLIERIAIEPADNAETLRDKVMLYASTLLPSVLQEIAEGILTPLEQEHAKATYCEKITRENGKINVYKESAQQILNKIRAYTPWPGCYLELPLKDHVDSEAMRPRLKLLEVEIDVASTAAKNVEPGKVVEIQAGKIGIGTVGGLLIPLKVQLEGKKPMLIADFLRGNRKMLE